MSNILKKILAKIVESSIGFLLSLFIPILYSTVISTIYTLSFIETFKNLPLWIWLITILFIVLWVIVKFIKSKMKEGIPYSFVTNVPLGGWEKIGEYGCMDLIWDVEVPNREFASVFNESLKENDIEIGSTRCPQCKTKIDYEIHYLWYTWNCVDPTCEFKKRTWKSHSKMENTVEKLVKREFERQIENKKIIRKT